MENDCENGEIKFGTFRIVDVFDVRNTKSVMQSQIQPNSGNVPYITASNANNAVGTCISCCKDLMDEGNCIVIGGKTIVVTYQRHDFVSNDSHNLALYLKDANKRTGRVQQYLVGAISKALSHKYYWGDSISKKKIQSDFLNLPVSPSGAIDYAYMERYIRAIEKFVIADVVRYKDKVIATTRAVVA